MKKLFTFLCLLMLTLSSAWAQEKSALMLEAEALAADADAVAVGKLIAAIDYATTNADESQLQDAVDQFKADNADQEKDETARVAVDYTKWAGATGFATWAAPQVTTYDGRTTYVVENYNGGSGSVVGEIFSQTITGLSTGSYKVAFYANANSTADRDAAVETGMVDGADDVAYVFANDEKEFLVAHRALSITENGEYSFEMELTEADGGTIKLGLGKAKEGTNWHTMQIKQLTWFTTAKAVFAADQAELQALITEAKALAADANKTEGKADFNDAIASAEGALGSNMYNIAEVEAIIAALKDAMQTFVKANYFIHFAAGAYYIIDAENGLMMAAGHDYGTRGIVNELGLDLILTPNETTHGVTIDTRISNGGTSQYLGSNLYMDATVAEWYLEYQGFGFYITNGTQYINIDGDNNLVMSDEPRVFIIVTAEGVNEQRLTELENATLSAPLDATFLIKDANFNRNDLRVEAWTVSDDCTNSNLSGGRDVNRCAESYHSTFTISQAITGAPAGYYQLTAQGFYTPENTENAPVFFANGETLAFPVQTGTENNMDTASDSFTAGDYTIEPILFSVSDDGLITLGVQGTQTDQWVIWDNFQLTYLGTEEPTTPDELVTLPAGVEPQTWTIEGTFVTSQGNSNVAQATQVAFDGTDVYVQGLAYYFEEAWLKGTLDTETGLVTFASGQFVGEDSYGKEYIVGSDDGETLCDIVFLYDDEAQTLTQVTAYIVENEYKTEMNAWGYWQNVTLTAGEPAVLEPITVPSDLVTETYRLTAYDTYFKEDVSRDVEVGFYGTNEVYFKGLSEYTDDDNWVVGTIDSDGVVTIPETFIGAYSSLFGDSNIFFPATTFTYDAETETFVSVAGFTTFDKDGTDWDELENVVLTKLTEREATPANPSFVSFVLYYDIKASDTELQFLTYPRVKLSIPVEDTEGNPMLTDKLSYVLYIIDASDVQQTLTITQDLYSGISADMTEIPYNFDDDWDINVGGNPFYLNQDPNEIATWKKIGVQSIYRGMDIEHRSEIVWYDIEAYIAEMQAELERVTGIDDILADSSRDRIVYDLQGRRVAAPTKGLYIINGKKVMMK